MPTYTYNCPACNVQQTKVCKIKARHDQTCGYCYGKLVMLPAAPLFKIDGKITPGGGPDRFTADALGIPLKELPPGLKTPKTTGD